MLLKSLTASLFCSSGPSLHVPRQNPGGASAGGGSEAVWHDLEEQLSDNHHGNNGYVTVVSVFFATENHDEKDADVVWRRCFHLGTSATSASSYTARSSRNAFQF